MNSSFLRLGWRTLWRDVRAGELRLLLVAVTLAGAALTSVGFFADRLQGGLERDALQLLGGDVVGMSTVPEVILARFLGLEVAAISTITNMAAGMSDENISHEHTKAMAPLGAAKLERILRQFLRGLR